ncbi:MAG: MaoC/PaaZ C-terminal domain-containing protein [Mycobacteriaceae bacterium]
MPIDPDIALGATLPVQNFSWTESDIMLYHLSIGCGMHPTDTKCLKYVEETHLQVLPTFATVAANFHCAETPKVSFPGIEIDLAKVVHGSQQVTVHAPLPTHGSASTTTRIVDIFDKGQAAVIVQESQTTTPDGTLLWTARSAIFARGEGGFGGNRGPTQKLTLPERAADKVIDIPTLPQQALLYRMCGDRNPLHSNPQFATDAGFPAPILHGLCTYAMVCRALTDVLLDSDACQVRSFSARFAGVVFPGETLRANVWSVQGQLLANVVSLERSTAEKPAIVLTDVVLETNNYR